MIAVVQRVKQASVTVNQKPVAQIGSGLLVLLGVSLKDQNQDAHQLAEKIGNLRIMPDKNDKMNRSIVDVGGELLVVPQFTLLADSSVGRRPGFIKAAPLDQAHKLYQLFVQRAKMLGLSVQTGQFGKYMDVKLTNNGPVTIIINTDNT